MPVVSNTSPILNLAIIGKLDLLRQQFEKVLIPQAVLDELRVEEELPGSGTIRNVLNSGWIIAQTVDNISLVKALQRNLDKGESEAIALAVQVNASKVLLDEREGRSVGKSLELNVTDILGVLCRAKEQGIKISLREAMDDLRSKAGFWINESLIAEILSLSDE